MIVDTAQVVGWDVIGELAKVAISFLSVLNKLKIWVDVGLASLATEWPGFPKRGKRHLVCALSVVELSRLG